MVTHFGSRLRQELITRDLVNYSTPCLFAAQAALEDEMKWLREEDGFLQKDRVGVQECTAVLPENLANKKR